MGLAMPVLTQVLVLFFVLAAGVLARRLRILNDQALGGLTGLTLRVCMPCLLFMAFQKKADALQLGIFFEVLLVCAAIHLAAALIAQVMWRSWPNERQRPILWHMTVLSNAAFMGLPMAEAAFGEEGLLYCSAYICCFNLVLWTVGMRKFTGGTLSLRAIANPGVLAIALGLLCFCLQVHLPALPQRMLQSVGQVTTPLSLLLVGARLADVHRADLTQRGVWLASIVRLVAMPGLCYLVLRLLGCTGILLGIPVIMAALPGAASTALFAERYGGDGAFASHCVSVSTLFCVVTLPAFMLLIGG